MAKTTKKIKAAKKIAETSKTVKAPKLDYTLEVSVNDLIYKAKAKDLTEALTDFINSPDFPFAIKTKVIIRYGKGNDIRQRLWHVPEARRIFSLIKLKQTALEILVAKLSLE